MSGKAYTMREMKAIVDYLVEHRAFGEIRGRKMWMDLASSNLTIRTWQSLKETFIKRILPDISNPYYKLTVQQIASFKQGCDIETKINNRLEIQTIDDDSSNNDAQNSDTQLPGPNNTKGQTDAGEELKPSKCIENRSSTDTVVIETCYKTAQDIQKDLESPKRDKESADSYYKSAENLESEKEVQKVVDHPKSPSSKSIRDYVTYSEPLTPMLQEVLHDFATDDEGDEPEMQIVEYPEPHNRHDNSSPIEIFDTENDSNENNGNKESNTNNESNTNKESNTNNHSKKNEESENIIAEQIDGDNNDKTNSNQELLQKSNTDNNVEFDSVQCLDGSKIGTKNNTSNNEVAAESIQKEEKSLPQDLQSHTTSITDTLPNNQEAFTEFCKTDQTANNSQNPFLNKNINESRKRAKSEEIQSMSPNKKYRSENGPHDLAVKTDISNYSRQVDTSAVDGIPSTSKSCSKIIKTDPSNSKQILNSDLGNKVNSYLVKKKKNNGDVELNGEGVILSDKSVSNKKNHPSNSPNEEIVKETMAHKDDASRESSTNKKRNNADKCATEVINEAVILKSHSESTSDRVILSPQKNRASLRATHKAHRDRAIANVFGYSGVQSNRKKHTKHRKRLISHQQILNSSESSDWSSDTGSEYVSPPPRGRKSKFTRKILKPKSARILSLEEEGGLFVMYGKKIYPLVKDGKNIKNYLINTPNIDSEAEEESYWKLKYVEEKKKTDELTKLLKHDSNNRVSAGTASNEPPAREPTPPPVACRKPSTTSLPQENIEKNSNAREVENKKEGGNIAMKTVKIKFMKNNEEVQLEGHWSQIHPVLEQVVNIMHKEPEPVEKPHSSTSVEDNGERRLSGEKPSQSLKSETNKAQLPAPDDVNRESPVPLIHVDNEVHEKIDKLEEEIFKEIEEREKTEETNVTKRKIGTGQQSSPAASDVDKTSQPPRKKRSLLTTSTVDSPGIVTRRQARISKQSDKEETEKVTNEVKKTTRRSNRGAVEPNDEEVKYNLRSPRAVTSNAKTTAKQTTKGKLAAKAARIFSSPESVSCNSIESSLGYQDSDFENINICVRKKRRLSLTVLNKIKGRSRLQKRRPTPSFQDDVSSDSNVSFVTASNSAVYRSDSCQMLFPSTKNYLQHLEKIEENSPSNNTNRSNNDNISHVHAEKSSSSLVEGRSLSPAFANYGENSGNYTLPPSPVLPIAEKLSVSQDELNCIQDEPDDSPEVRQTTLNKYMASDVDMSVPLMEQQFNIKERHNETEFHYNLNTQETAPVSDSLINKVCAVNIQDPTLSESINQKLQNLLIESAKKRARCVNNESNVDMEVVEAESRIKTMTKKRCSTPRKIPSKRKSKVNNIEPIVEQEYMESCSSKKSCPPPVLIVTEPAENNEATEVPNETCTDSKKLRVRKKKDVIKIKILKPKAKKKRSRSDDTMQTECKASLQADSGINDTESGVFLRGFEDSTELIHNHSDTCLRACGSNGDDDSVQFVNDNANSVIFLNTSSESTNVSQSSQSVGRPNENKLVDICCENAQDVENLTTATATSRLSNASGSIFDNIANVSAANSLLTDDLSDEPPAQTAPVKKRVSTWHLLSEDEASNSNTVDLYSTRFHSNSGCGSNLQQIFPIVCAVPDLSTITEENTAKFMFDGNTKTDCDTKSLPG